MLLNCHTTREFGVCFNAVCLNRSFHRSGDQILKLCCLHPFCTSNATISPFAAAPLPSIPPTHTNNPIHTPVQPWTCLPTHLLSPNSIPRTNGLCTKQHHDRWAVRVQDGTQIITNQSMFPAVLAYPVILHSKRNGKLTKNILHAKVPVVGGRKITKSSKQQVPKDYRKKNRLFMQNLKT